MHACERLSCVREGLNLALEGVGGGGGEDEAPSSGLGEGLSVA